MVTGRRPLPLISMPVPTYISSNRYPVSGLPLVDRGVTAR
jgi:hypothetical protein